MTSDFEGWTISLGAGHLGVNQGSPQLWPSPPRVRAGHLTIHDLSDASWHPWEVGIRIWISQLGKLRLVMGSIRYKKGKSWDQNFSLGTGCLPCPAQGW